MKRLSHSYFYFALLFAASLVLWWNPLRAVFGLALENEAYTHILLILPLSVCLVYLDRKLLTAALKPNMIFGAALLVFSLLLAATAKWAASGMPTGVPLSVSMVALVVWWIASVILCFGVQTFRTFLFPLCFLFWLVPIPEFALGEIILVLQHQSAFAARLLFQVARVPVVQDGVILSIPGLDLEVARECSSIRSSLVLIVSSMVLAQILLRSKWRKAVVIAASFPLAVAKNGLRIFVLGELGTRVDPSYLDGNLHHRGGSLYLGAALVVVVALILALRRNEFSGVKGSAE
jgi:exosortase